MMKYITTLLFLFSIHLAHAELNSQLENPAVEARLKALSQELRCLVCQNQTLADSSAPLAEDLRVEIRELITKGLSDKEIEKYLVARYGDFVRYRPPVKPQTYLLWGGPTAFLLLGLVGLWLALRQRNKVLLETIEQGEEA